MMTLMEHVARKLDSGETMLADHTIAWARINLSATYAYAERLARKAQTALASVMEESLPALRARLVRSAEGIRTRAEAAEQYSAAIAALRAQGDWLLPKQQPTGDQHVHLHFAAELDAVEARMRAARAIAAGFPPLLATEPPEAALLDGGTTDSAGKCP